MATAKLTVPILIEWKDIEAHMAQHDIVKVVRCKDCKHLSADRIAPEWHRICRKYGVGKPDDGFCDEVERKGTEDDSVTE